MRKPHDKFIPAKKGEVRNPLGINGSGVVPSMRVFETLLNDPELSAFPDALREKIIALYGPGKTAMQLMGISMINEALKGNVNAFREILNRAEGKVPDNLVVANTSAREISEFWQQIDGKTKTVRPGDEGREDIIDVLTE